MPVLDPQSLLAIGCCAVATYSLRCGGLLLAARLPRKGRLRRGMDALPGALLLALVVPGIVEAGPWGWLAAAVTAVTAWKHGNLLLAMLLGMLTILVQRHGMG